MPFLIPEFIVEDKNLPKVLRALAGLVVNLQAPRPVVNAEVIQGKVKQIRTIEGSPLVMLVAQKIRESNLTEITSTTIRNFIAEVGGQTGSYSYFIGMLHKMKVLKKSKVRGTYLVIEPKE